VKRPRKRRTQTLAEQGVGTHILDLTLNPPAATSPTPTPAEQAEQAQQRADCLKLAVKNPTINCKQPAKGNE
jgi:hypothetical protein